MRASGAIAIVGARGQLGQDLCRAFGARAVPLGHQEIELRSRPSVHAAIRRVAPEAVVNVAAYNLVDRAEDEPEAAFAVNACGVRYLAEVCAELNVPLVHFSTDYVFGRDAQRSEPYSETDLPGPVNCYGASKLAGEQLALLTHEQVYVLRTCGVYGLHGRGGKGTNFVETMLRLGAERPEIRVVADQRCTPTFSEDLAAAVVELVDARPPCGLYHLTNAGQCSWYEFAAAIFELSGLAVRCTPIPSEAYPTRARRPRFSVLSNRKWQAAGLRPLRPWRSALEAYLQQRGRLNQSGHQPTAPGAPSA